MTAHLIEELSLTEEHTLHLAAIGKANASNTFLSVLRSLRRKGYLWIAISIGHGCTKKGYVLSDAGRAYLKRLHEYENTRT